MNADNQSKYFTPAMEDIRVGYECEVKHLPEDQWEKITLRAFIDIGDIYSFIRVPYLTKEQIEAEGWKKIWENGPISFNGEYTWFIEFLDNYRIRIDRIKDLRADRKSIMFEGECKDINTFRYICKLLGI